MIAVIVILAMINVGVIYSIFDIRQHVKKHTSMNAATVLLLAKIATAHSVPKEEIDVVLKDLNKML